VDGIQQLASQIQTVLSGLPQVRSVFSEKVAQGFYVDVDVNREEAARYGLTIVDVQTAVSSGIGGQNIAENIEGRERYPINLRYQRDFRDNLDEMRRVLIGTPSGVQIPLGQVARISFTHGRAMIRDEDGALTGYIYIDLKNTDYGGFVRNADKLLHDQLALLPANYSFQWSGEYELELRAKQRLQLILPVVLVPYGRAKTVLYSCCVRVGTRY
jgi:copper/silver efflux system protein